MLLAELANSASAGGKTAIAGMAESASKIGLAELGKVPVIPENSDFNRQI